jgi:hypothetical protein
MDHKFERELERLRKKIQTSKKALKKFEIKAGELDASIQRQWGRPMKKSNEGPIHREQPAMKSWQAIQRSLRRPVVIASTGIFFFLPEIPPRSPHPISQWGVLPIDGICQLWFPRD